MTDWIRLDLASEQRFRWQRAALLEVVRSALPTRYSRHAIDDKDAGAHGAPVEIWVKGPRDFAFVWRLKKGDGEPHRGVGFASIGHGGSVEYPEAGKAGSLPDAFSDCRRLSFTEPFWRNAHERALARAGGAAATPAPTPKPAADIRSQADAAFAAGPSPRQKISEAIAHIDAALPVELNKRYGVEFGTGPVEAAPAPGGRRDWHRLETLDERNELARMLEDARVGNFSFHADDPRLLVFHWRTPFYRHCRLVRIIDQRGPRSRFANFVLHDVNHDLCALHRRSDPIAAFNERRAAAGDLAIRGDTVAAYLRFYCEFVQARKGAFPIIERGTDLRWIEQDLPAPRRLHAAFDAAITPVQLYRLPASAKEMPMACRAFVAYDRDVFLAGFFVSEDGTVLMFADARAAPQELPIEAINFNTEFQFALRVLPARRAAPSAGG